MLAWLSSMASTNDPKFDSFDLSTILRFTEMLWRYFSSENPEIESHDCAKCHEICWNWLQELATVNETDTHALRLCTPFESRRRQEVFGFFWNLHVHIYRLANVIDNFLFALFARVVQLTDMNSIVGKFSYQNCLCTAKLRFFFDGCCVISPSPIGICNLNYVKWPFQIAEIPLHHRSVDFFSASIRAAP